MANRCFISYSTVDALDFARKLANKLEEGPPHIPVWFDKDDLKPSREWDIQIDEALKTCRMVLFVMTADSTHEKSVCKQEWSRALSYKKPILPLWHQNEIIVPFRLQDRQRIDFRTNFDSGLAQLRDYITWLDSPEGILEGYNERLLDAERDIQRASDTDKSRIQAEIDKLNKQIELQQKIVDDPKAAQAQTQKSIEAGLERERQSKKPITSNIPTKFINPAPGIAPNYFQDRQFETHEIVKFLQDESQRLMIIVGRGGVGKTAMVCRLLKELERGQLPDDLGEMNVDGIVYLSESGSHRINFANIFYDLCKLLPSEVQRELDAVYKNPQDSTENKIRLLLEKFGNGRVVLLLDNFESLVDTKSFDIRDAELDEVLRAFLNGTHTSVNIVITTRVAPKSLNLIQPGRQRRLTLEEGLESPFAENILRKMDSDGRLGLKFAGAEALDHARIKTRGFPLALEALFAILSFDRYTTLDEVLAMPLPENFVETYVGEVFNRLETNTQKVIQALAIYNRPVTPAAVDYLLAPYLPAIDSALILNQVSNLLFARKVEGKYVLHSIEREFAFGLITISPESSDNDSDELHFTQPALLERAADYFAQTRKPREEWKNLDDISAQLAEFDLRCQIGDYYSAAHILREINFDCLYIWGFYDLLIHLNLKIVHKVENEYLRMIILNGLVLAYISSSKSKDSLVYSELGLSIARKLDRPDYESLFTWNLSLAYADLGYTYQSIEYGEKSILLSQASESSYDDSILLSGLSDQHRILGNLEKAIKYAEQALSVAQSNEFDRGKSNALSSLGRANIDLGDTVKAMSCFEQALKIRQEMGDRKGEAIDFIGMGQALISINNYKKSIECLERSIYLAAEITFPVGQVNSHYILSQVYLFQADLVNAYAIIERVLQYEVPSSNHIASALHGIIALRQGGMAQEAFMKSIAQADEILAKTPEYYEALDAKGLALCGLAICDDKKHVADAIETFRAARKIAPHTGIVKRNLRLFDELVKCDEQGILKDVRDAVEGK